MVNSPPMGVSRRSLCSVVIVGALLGGCSSGFSDPTQGAVEARIVNDSSHTVLMGVCTDSKCTDPVHLSAIGVGEAFVQIIQPYTTLKFVTRAVAKPAEPPGCIELAVGSRVANRYDLSKLQPCR